jgi:hypothetical protein
VDSGVAGAVEASQLQLQCAACMLRIE